jgi:outer membrane protein assembly factor BamB
MEIIAVIPIFVNAGAAVLPTIVAAVASIAATAFKPRELVCLFRRQPAACGITAGAVAVGLGIAIGCLTPGKPGHNTVQGSRSAIAHYDWAKVAQDLIASQQTQQTSGVAATAATTHQTDPITSAAARQNSSRSSDGGGSSPVGLTPLWSFRPEDTMFLGTPAVVRNCAYAAGCQTDLGGYTGLLACLDIETGKPLWQATEIKSEPMRPFLSSPAVTPDGKYLVIGQGLHEDRDCSLLCFDATTGQLRWAVKTTLHIESSPAIAGDIVVVGAGAIEGKDGRPVGDPGYCLAVRISDGRELWRQPVNDPESSPAIDASGVVYIGSGFNGSAVVAIRSESNEQLRAGGLDRIAWRAAVAQPIPGPITLAGDVVIAGGGNSDLVHSNRNAQGLVIALDRKTGAIRWQTAFDDAVLGGIACDNEVLICPGRTGEVVALTLEDGQVLWRTRISGNSPLLGGCTLAGRRAYVVSSDGYLAVLRLQDGKILEKVYLNDQGKPGIGLAISTPRIAGERVIVGSETGGLRCFVGSGGSR